MSSPVERFTSMRKPALENRAPELSATEWTTSRSPRVDQHVGDRLAQRLALGDRQQVLWLLLRALSTRSCFVEPFRADEHRPRHLDVVVEGEHPMTPLGAFATGAAGSRACARLGLDRARELGEHFVEQIDLLVRIALGAATNRSVMRDSMSMRCALLPAASACSSSSISDDISVMIYMSGVGIGQHEPR